MSFIANKGSKICRKIALLLFDVSSALKYFTTVQPCNNKPQSSVSWNLPVYDKQYSIYFCLYVNTVLQVFLDSTSVWEAVSCKDTLEMHHFRAADILALRMKKVTALLLEPRSFKGKINLNLLICVSLCVPIKRERFFSS